MNAFKVVLVNPGPGEILERGRIVSNADHVYPPLGICYLSSILKSENYHVDLIDQAAMQYNLTQTLEWIKKKDPDVVGFSTLTASGSGISAAITSEEIKKWNPDLKIVFGNRHATHNDYRILNKYSSVDICVRDEGEYTFLELIKALERNKPLTDIRGITYREDNKIKRNEARPLIKDLDSIPFPDRSALNIEYTGSFGGLEFAPQKFTSMISSRGCPYQCTFCYGKRSIGFRTRSVENILEEILLLENEGYKYLNFIDDNFTVSKKRVIKLSQLMRKNKVDLDWVCEGRINQVSDEMLREMHRSNCKIMFYGIESANQRILDYYKKNITPSQSILAVKKTRKAKIPFIMGSFIVGAPGETLSEIYNTLMFAQIIDIDFPIFNLLGTMPGTDIWDELVEKNILDEEKYWEQGVHISDIDPNGVPTETISNLILDMLKQFFMNPKYLIKAFYRSTTNFYKLTTLLKIVSLNLKNFKDFHGVKSFWNPDNV